MNDIQNSSGAGLDPGPAPRDPAGRRTQGVLFLRIGMIVCAAGFLMAGALWAAPLARDPAWRQAARAAWRSRATSRATPGDPGFRTRYAHDLLRLAARSPVPLRTYLDWRVDRHCEAVRAQTPPGTYGTCRQRHLERMLLRGDGRGLIAAALHELDGAPPHWIAPLHRYAGRGGVLDGDWDLAQEHFTIAFTAGEDARDALRAGWAALRAGQPAVALGWLDRAFAANGGYPSPAAVAAVRNSMLRPSDQERYLASIAAETAFYDACRGAAYDALDGKPLRMPDKPSWL